MTPHASTSMREGFALPMALLAMMVIGAIVTGGFYASSQGSQISTSTDLGSQAFYVAEYGLNEALGTWRNAALVEVADTQSMDPDSVVENGRTLGRYALHVRRLGPSIFLLTSVGRVTGGQQEAVRRVGAIVRTAQPQMPAPTALAVYGGLTVGGNSNIHGNDAGGPDCVQGDTVAGVTAYDSTLVDPSNRDKITGSPPIDENTALDTSGLSDFGDIDLQELIAAATKIYEAGESENGMAPATTTDANGNTICDTSIRSNWGEPSDTAHACYDKYPIIYAKGNLHLKTGVGQGILIVEGNLKASGNFDFYGIVIVLGELETTGTGNHIEGSVIVQGHGMLDSESTTLGNSLVQYSRCRVDNAFNASLRPRLLASRSWLDFTAATQGATTFTPTGS